jgi:hypothetical protein
MKWPEKAFKCMSCWQAHAPFRTIQPIKYQNDVPKEAQIQTQNIFQYC